MPAASITVQCAVETELSAVSDSHLKNYMQCTFKMQHLMCMAAGNVHGCRQGVAYIMCMVITVVFFIKALRCHMAQTVCFKDIACHMLWTTTAIN